LGISQGLGKSRISIVSGLYAGVKTCLQKNLLPNSFRKLSLPRKIKPETTITAIARIIKPTFFIDLNFFLRPFRVGGFYCNTKWNNTLELALSYLGFYVSGNNAKMCLGYAGRQVKNLAVEWGR
jgi:hypothetical protein